MELTTDNLATDTKSRGTQAPASLQPGNWLITEHHPRRHRVEQFIAGRFLEIHGARISAFMPTLLALFDDRGDVRAAVGIRSAATGGLFLEHYLDTPIDKAIASNARRALSLPPSRQRIVEIGNLASRDRHASQELFKILAAVLHAENFEWAVFTGCTSLHRMFTILGIETIYLGRALQSRLPADQQTWGSYYEDSPRVVAGKVSRGLVAFADTPRIAQRRAAA